jgi:hypothetical protein
MIATLLQKVSLFFFSSSCRKDIGGNQCELGQGCGFGARVAGLNQRDFFVLKSCAEENWRQVAVGHIQFVCPSSVLSRKIIDNLITDMRAEQRLARMPMCLHAPLHKSRRCWYSFVGGLYCVFRK